MKKEDAYNEDEFVHDVLDFLVEYNKTVRQGIDKLIELQDRIDKAIENIEEYKRNDYSTYYENEIEVELIDKLLDILKGSDKE